MSSHHMLGCVGQQKQVAKPASPFHTNPHPSAWVASTLCEGIHMIHTLWIQGGIAGGFGGDTGCVCHRNLSKGLEI